MGDEGSPLRAPERGERVKPQAPGSRRVRWFTDFDIVSRVYDVLPIPTHPEPIRERLDTQGPFVDLGGGTGRLTQALHGEQAGSIVADASRGMLAKAKRRGLGTVQATGQALPFPDASLGAVTITEAFHHFAPHQDAVMGEIQRVLREDGVLLIEEIDPTRWSGRILEFGEHLIGFQSVFLESPELEAKAKPRFASTSTTRTGRFTYLLEARGPRESRG